MQKRVILPVLLAVIFVFGGCSLLSRSEENLVELHVYHTNDIHSHLMPNSEGEGGMAYLASVLKTVRKLDPEALVIDAGDIYNKGSLPAVLSHDGVMADLLAQMPYYDLRAVGNNDIKAGIPYFLEYARTKESWPLISANFVDKDKKPVFKPYVVLKKKGLKIGLIGLTTHFKIDKEDQASPDTDKRAPYEVLKPKEIIEPLIKELRPQVDVLILVSHQSLKKNEELAKEFKEIDLVVSGHAHLRTPETKAAEGPMVVETGAYGHELGYVTLIFNREEKKVVSKDSSFWAIGEDYQVPDEKIQTMITEMYKKLAPDAQKPIAFAEERLDMINAKHPGEGPVNNFVADILAKRAKADVGLINLNMLREDLYRGTINKDSIYWTAPYDDDIATVEVPAATFKQMVGDGIKKGFKGNCCMPFAFSNVKVHIFLEKEKTAVKSVQVFPPQKAKLKVAIPFYLHENCTDFFEAQYCAQMKNVKKVMEVRKSIFDEVMDLKTVRAPLLNRVSIQ